MASIEEVKGWIRDRIYPHVARTSDPLIVRVSRFSLLVNDTNFYAKIKNGLGYKGYLIYSSGLGTPILEESATNETEFFSNNAFKKAISDNGTDTGNKFYESAERVLSVLQDAAQSWLDTIELEIAKQPNDNAIKKAIDRLCWQLHYDITESHTNFPEVFKDNDFGDVEIDRYPMETQYWDGTTLKTAISDVAGLEFNGGQPRSYEITYNGYLYESAERIKNFDNHLTLGSYSDSQGAITTFDDHLTLGSRDNNKGAIKTFDDHLMLGLYNDKKGAITLFDEHLLKNYYDDGNGAFKKFNDALNDSSSGSLIKIGTKLVPDGNYYSISECLREYSKSGENGFTTYSIARSLREDIGTDDSGKQTSVSQATHDQTELEEDKFNEISETKLGDFGSTGKRTLAQVLDGYVESTNQSLSGAVGYTYHDVSENATQKSVESMIGCDDHVSTRSIIYTILHNPGVVKTDYINAYSPPQGSMMGSVNTIYNKVDTIYNHDDTFTKTFFGDGATNGVWGGVHGNSNWVRAMTPSDGHVWNV